MLTRVEIDGFKSFENFELALPPFAVILGPNASGKSNLFDALRLLSRLAVMDVRSAMRELRGEPNELFRHLPDGTVVERMRLAVETLLEPRVEDDYGQDLQLTCTRIRYEITVVRRTVSGINRFFVESEYARPVRKTEDHWAPHGRRPSAAFRQHFMKYTSRVAHYLDTDKAGEKPEFRLHQDNKQGRIRRLPAVEAERSVLSTVTLASEFPHLYALQKELQGLRYLQLDPAAERQPSSLDAPEMLEQDGSNLAAVLYRIGQETGSPEQPRGAEADILADLTEIIPGVAGLLVERDDERREYRLRLTMSDGQQFSARVVSDGTLRVLSLLTLLHDPRHRGILCFEEPENGVHKYRLEKLMAFLQESCAQPHDLEVGAKDSLLQIIVNTHSIIAVRAIKNAVILAQLDQIVSPGSPMLRHCTRMRPYVLSEQGRLVVEDKAGRATIWEIERFLEQSERDSRAA